MWLMAYLIILCEMLTAQTCVQPPSGSTSWWPRDGDHRDIQGSNDGIVCNGVGFALGYVGHAFSFDGVDDYVQIPNASRFAVTSVTIEAWVKPSVTNKCNRIVCHKQTRQSQ